MCRAALYFRSMRTHIDKWDEERHERHLEKVFNEAFDDIFEDVEEGLEMFGSWYFTWRIACLQERFNKLVDTGYDPEDMVDDDDIELYTYTTIEEGDPTEDPLLFVSKNKTNKRKARNGKRTRSRSRSSASDSGLMICIVVL